jgi:nucleoside-diphosphate-sugar epimerase
VHLGLFGGTAFLGRRIAEAGVARGHTVTAIARGTAGSFPSGVRSIVLDRAGSTAHQSLAVESFDAVVELTWQPSFSRAALDVLSASTAKWLFISSVSVYERHDRINMGEDEPLLRPFTGEVATLDVYGEAKVACERATLAVRGDQCLIVRPGLIGGPGDVSDRSGAWVARAAAGPTAPLLIPERGACHVQVLDVRDLATFVITALETDQTGVCNAVGTTTPFHDFVELSRRIGGHHADQVEVPWVWLSERGVTQWAGPDSLACFVADSDMAGWGRVNGNGAVERGLTVRSLEETLTDSLSDERTRGLTRPRRAGLSLEREHELLAAFAASTDRSG